MADITPTLQDDNSKKTSPSNSDINDSAISCSSITGWTVKYKDIPKSTQSKGIWDGYQTKEEFVMMHLR
ncbi:hypothetical protein I4U23_002729 [Adineta vaga]|nr:hypothetical protein I4U23_002729 [Adineta vaga]